MNLCSMHENMKSQYRRAAIDIAYVEQSNFHSAQSACFWAAANESHLLYALIRVTSERLLRTSLRFFLFLKQYCIMIDRQGNGTRQ